MEAKFKSISDFKNKMATNLQLQEEFRKDPVEAAKKIEQQDPLKTDPLIYRMVVGSLGATVLLIILGIILLMSTGKILDDKAVPTIFTAIGSAAIGALAGLLAPAPRENSNG